MKGKENTQYTPGVCNIGPANRQKRFLTGALALIAGVAIWIILKSQIALYLFSIIGFVGLIQARMSFCVAYGLKNSMNLDEGEKKLLESEATKNRIQAAKIILISIIAGVVFAFIISRIIT